MTVYLAPGKIVTKVSGGGIRDCAGIECWEEGRVEWCASGLLVVFLLDGGANEVLVPMEDVGRRECADDCADKFVSPAFEELGIALEDEGVFIGHAIGEGDICDRA